MSSGPKFLKIAGMPDEDAAAAPPPTSEQSVDYAENLVDEDGDSYEIYQSLYAYKSADPDDLNFSAGEIIRVTDAGEHAFVGHSLSLSTQSPMQRLFSCLSDHSNSSE